MKNKNKLSQILGSLSKTDRRAIMYAFEHGISFTINLPDGKFIGVNVVASAGAGAGAGASASAGPKIIESSGVWVYGEHYNGS